jgi:hypothetical protein
MGGADQNIHHNAMANSALCLAAMRARDESGP